MVVDCLGASGGVTDVVSFDGKTGRRLHSCG